MSGALSGKAAIVGIGSTEFSKNSGRSELQLCLEACKAALDDAGIAPRDVDGLVTFSMDSSPSIMVGRGLGIAELRFFSLVDYGGGAACATVAHAAAAVNAGLADVVVCYRAFNERSGRRFGTGEGPLSARGESPMAQHYGYYVPYGLMTPAAWVAMAARRYMHHYGATSEDFGRIAVVARAHAATNPAAWFHDRPITLEDHQASRMIADPLRLLDCCQESDGGVAVVVVSAERARDLAHGDVLITGAAQGSSHDQQMMTGYYREDITGLPEMGIVARQLWKQSGLGPDDIQTAVIYDHFTPFVLTQLEEFGFCARGEAKDFVRDGAIALGGRLPLNPHGGQLGEAYVHGMNGITEAVRQLRGTAANQVPGARNVVVTAGTGVPTSGLVLSRR
jgi:acetyl-CoA acetyltransferase